MVSVKTVLACDAGPAWRKKIEAYDSFTIHAPRDRQTTAFTQTVGVHDNGYAAALALLAIAAVWVVRKLMSQ